MKAPKFYNGTPDAKENERFYRDVADAITKVESRVSDSQASSTAITVEDLRDDLNGLIAKLKAAGVMEG